MKNIKYKPEFIDLVFSLAKIQNSIVIDREDGKVNLCMQDNDSNLAYSLRADVEYFDLDKELALADFSELYSYYKAAGTPTIAFDGHKITMVGESGIKIQYVATDVDMIEMRIETPNLESPEVGFALSDAKRAEVNKLIDLVGAQYIHMSIHAEDKKIVLGINNGDKSNSVEVPLPLEFVADGVTSFTLNIHPDAFKKIPKANYTVTVHESTFVKMHMETDASINLDIMCGEMEVR